MTRLPRPQQSRATTARCPAVTTRSTPAGQPCWRAPPIGCASARETTADKDVLRRRWLPIDIDPKRPAGIMASAVERQAAGSVGKRVRAYLEEQGWPDGLVVMSGSGYHLDYLIDLPNDEASRDLLKRLLEKLAEQFSTDDVTIDTSLYNAARISKVPGTMVCKGDAIADRPHRRSCLTHRPQDLEVVTREQILAIAGEPSSPRPKSSGNGHGQFDVEAFIASHLQVRRHKQDGSGDLKELTRCPFNPEHNRGEAFVRRDASGSLSAGCQHESCAWQWAELRELYEPKGERGKGDRAGQSCTPAAEREGSESPSAMPPLADERDLLRCFIDALHRAGIVGEDRFAKLTYLCVTSRLLDRPVSLAAKGPSSAGKSKVVERVLAFFPPPAYYALTAMSEHAMAYSAEPLEHRFLVLYEAAGLESDFASYLIRSLLSEGCIDYETVEKVKGGGLQPRHIHRDGPTGLIVTTTRVHLHPENETRLLSVAANDTPEQTKSVLRLLARQDDESVEVPAGWLQLQSWIAEQDNRTVIPFALALAELVPPVAVRLRRDFTTVLNLISAHAILHQCNRPRDERGRIVATLTDYAVVRELVADLIAEQVEATVPLAVRETLEAVAALRQQQPHPVSYTELAAKLKLDKSAARRRAAVAADRGYLRNLETRRGQPAQLVLGAPLPGDIVVLPMPDEIDWSAL